MQTASRVRRSSNEAFVLDRQACSGETFVQSFRGSAVGREPGIHNHRSGSMDSGLASASLRRPGMTPLTKVDTLAQRVLTPAGLVQACRTSRTENAVRQRIVTLSIIALLCAAAGTAHGQSADIVAVNGKVFTARDGAGFAQGFAVRGEKFIAVGSTEAMRAHVGANTRVIDLGGRFVTPGLADGHFHNEGGGPGIDLAATRSIGDLLTAVGAAAAQAKPGDLIVSNSDWHEAQLKEQRLPLAAELDRV